MTTPEECCRLIDKLALTPLGREYANPWCIKRGRLRLPN